MKSSIGSITTKNWLKFRIRLAGWQRQTCPNSNILSRWRNIIVLDINWNSFLFDWAETMSYGASREREGRDWASVRVIYQKPEYRLRSPTLITEMRPVMIWILRYLQPWLLHTMMSVPPLCITLLLRVDFHFTMEWSPLLNWILSGGAMLYPSQSPSPMV